MTGSSIETIALTFENIFRSVGVVIYVYIFNIACDLHFRVGVRARVKE